MSNNFILFGFNDTELQQLQYVQQYVTEEDALIDVEQKEKQYVFSHYVIYKKADFGNEMFKHCGFLRRVVSSSRLCGMKCMSWCPQKYYTNDHSTFYFQ